MSERILNALATLAIASISGLGYLGIVLMMALESACFPLPSEVIMPFSGYLVASGRFSLQGVALAGTLGCLLGSYAAYFVGANGGRRFLERYGRYLLIAPDELELADRFFARWGREAVFIARLLPVVRTFIAFPAGVSRMALRPFSFYTVLGSYPWCFGLAWLGMELGRNWASIGPMFHRFDQAILAALAIAAALFLWSRLRAWRRGPKALPEQFEP